MAIEDNSSVPSPNDDLSASVEEYLARASDAVATGSPTIAMHLYLAAFEQGLHADGSAPDEAAIKAVKQAWALACGLRERSIAEYVFERMEPYLTNTEVASCAEQLQALALDKLEEFGLSREELEDMTEMISQDFAAGADARLLRVQHVASPADGKDAQEGRRGPRNSNSSVAQADKPVGDMPLFGMLPGPADAQDPTGQKPEPVEVSTDSPMGDEAHLTYSELVGYDAAIEAMRSLGIGMGNDPEFRALVSQLNARHGLDHMPACDALLVTSPAREDANHFMMATIGELGLPVIRMRMEENMQGMPVLCVMAQTDNQPKLNAARNAFDGPGLLVIEDIDMWMAPDMAPNSVDDFGGLIMASLSRGAREAVNLIRNAADNPEVYVIATAASGCDVDPFFLDLLGPTSLIDIDYPTEAERADIWMQIAREHPSARAIDRESLVRYSEGLPRFDIYMAAREAIEGAYKESLVQRRYVPVTSDNMFDKLAAYQPLDSKEYQQLEQAVIDGFKSELEHIDDLLKGEGE